MLNWLAESGYEVDVYSDLDLHASNVLEGYAAVILNTHPEYWSVPMRRAVEKFLEDPLAEELLRGKVKSGDTLDVYAAGEQLEFKVGQPEHGEPANA